MGDARTPEFLRELLRQMLRIRLFQLRIESLYHLDEMKTPVHLCVGQEAIAVGFCAALRRDDYISSNHRSHGHYLAKGGDLKALIAELYCRETGCSSGRGGSMHLIDTAVGHLGSSSIVGGGIPIGAGLALAAKMQGRDAVCAVFFGDGAADEGVLYETLNFAMLKKLPALFILENNQWSVCSHVSARQAGENVFHGADQGLLLTMKIDGNDVLSVHEAAVRAVARARSGQGPSFIECATYRMRGHAGAGSDAHLGHRCQADIDDWAAKCPVESLRGRLRDQGILSSIEADDMERQIEAEISDAFAYAQSSPLPRGEDLERNLFRG